MASFEYARYDAPDEIRPDLVAAHRNAWTHIAAPGSWLTGAERVSIAEETRRARSCALCRERKAALSPYSVEGQHDHGRLLEPLLVDEVHRVTTDPQRLTQKWFEELISLGLTAERYVEALGVTVLTISIDAFHHALGLPLEPLPVPADGEPSGYRPIGTTTGEAWVPMMEIKRASADDKALLAGPGGRSANVIRALSLVPDEVRAWTDLADAQYLPREEMLDMGSTRAIDRSQIELVAGRVSALNECFY